MLAPSAAARCLLYAAWSGLKTSKSLRLIERISRRRAGGRREGQRLTFLYLRRAMSSKSAKVGDIRHQFPHTMSLAASVHLIPSCRSPATELQYVPVKLKSALLPFLAVFLSHRSLSSIEYSQARFRSKSSPVSRASAFSPIASACFRFRSSLTRLRAVAREALVSAIKSLRFAWADSVYM